MHFYQFRDLLFDCYNVSKFICRTCLDFSPHPCLRWRLSSVMTKSVQTPLHRVLFLWWPWWRQRPWVSRCWSPLTHLDVSPVPSHHIHVAHFRLFRLPSTINISSYVYLLPFHCRLPWKEEIIGKEIHQRCESDLDLIPGQRFWRVVFIYGFLMYALQNLLTLALWLMAL